MSALSELLSKAEAAQHRFGELGERQREVDLRLRNLNGLVEDGLKYKQSADADLASEIEHLKAENESLRQIVESLIEAANGPDAESLTGALMALEQNTASLVEDRSVAAEAQPESGSVDTIPDPWSDPSSEGMAEDGASPTAPYVVSSTPEAEFADAEGAVDGTETPVDADEDGSTNAFSKIRKHIGRGR